MASDTQRILTADTQSIDLTSTVGKGIMLCRNGDWQAGIEMLRKAARRQDEDADMPSLYYSYLGYGTALLDGERRDGLALCKHAAQMGPREPDNFLNLARMYLLINDRRRAVTALQYGLRLEPRHSGLLAQRQRMGYRRRPTFPFLPRKLWLNRWLGRRRHRRFVGGGAKT